MSYNSLTSLGPLSRYPVSLKQLDLSHNQISAWPLESDSDWVAPSSLLHLRSWKEAVHPECKKFLDDRLSEDGRRILLGQYQIRLVPR